MLGGVVGARSHLQGSADGLDSEFPAVAVDVVDDHFCGRSSSAAKKADADLRIALARRSSRFSCSNALILARPSLEVPAFRPSSTSVR